MSFDVTTEDGLVVLSVDGYRYCLTSGEVRALAPLFLPDVAAALRSASANRHASLPRRSHGPVEPEQPETLSEAELGRARKAVAAMDEAEQVARRRQRRHSSLIHRGSTH